MLFSYIPAFCQALLVDELRNWIQENGITPIKSQKKEGEISNHHSCLDD